MNSDTIAAISTGLQESGIGIIRISGPDAISAADRLYINKNKKHTLLTYPSHTIHYGFITDGTESDNIIDEVMVSVLKAPSTYTCEDTVEINCHGGIRVCKTILDTILNTGVRIAEPGEFTKRAFLNGRLDLTQAEAVMDVIRSESDLALHNSVEQLRGNLNILLNNICSDILYEIAFIESAIDDPDSYDLDGYSSRLKNKITEIKTSLNDLINSYDNGRILSEGIRTVILGKPNVGKSSLLNTLVGDDRAIVTDIPGTTRDILTETIRIGDIILHVTDTAGIRETDDPIESIGVKRAISAIDRSDLVIYVCDGSETIDEEDYHTLTSLTDKKYLMLINKSDLMSEQDISYAVSQLVSKGITENNIIITSVNGNLGIDDLKHRISEMFYSDELRTNNSVIITNYRHADLLRKAALSLQKVEQSLDLGVSEDFYVIDLTDAYTYLAAITGREVNEDIVNEIFSKFCMGK